MKLPDTIRQMLFTAALAVTISITSQLRAAVVEDTGFPAPLPEWKTPAQLKVWRAETTAKTLAKEAAARAAQVKAVVSSATPSGFYTGKPYMAETGSYAFKYRDYNPEMARWTTVDPSGFPDGANNRVYAAAPTSEFDDSGLSPKPIYTYSASYYQKSSWTETLEPNFAFPISISFAWINTSGTKTKSFGTHQSGVTLLAGYKWLTGETINSTEDSGPVINGSYIDVPYTTRSVTDVIETDWSATYE